MDSPDVTVATMESSRRAAFDAVEDRALDIHILSQGLKDKVSLAHNAFKVRVVIPQVGP